MVGDRARSVVATVSVLGATLLSLEEDDFACDRGVFENLRG